MAEADGAVTLLERKGMFLDEGAREVREGRGREGSSASSADPGARAASQHVRVDAQLVGGVLPGQQPRDHPRVERDRAVHDERDLRVAPRRHRQPPQELDVRVACAHQHDSSGHALTGC